MSSGVGIDIYLFLGLPQTDGTFVLPLQTIFRAVVEASPSIEDPRTEFFAVISASGFAVSSSKGLLSLTRKGKAVWPVIPSFPYAEKTLKFDIGRSWLVPTILYIH